ncbi:MAG: class I SAM-dependent methyltransferase [Parachlamydia sp.]|nr:class I SAM-dependent methyltransferase [Parachlamydia sp.]
MLKSGVIDYLIGHEGSYYLPYQHFATLEQFQACYPNWKSVNSFKQTIDPAGLFNNGFLEDYLTCDVKEDSLFRRVFNRVDGQRSEISNFLNHIFMQLDEKKFFTLVDSILENPQLHDDEIYASLYKKINQAKPNKIATLQNAIKSLNCLKKDLGDQTAQLVGLKEINGYIEIGYPGRMMRPLKTRIGMQGPFYAITDKECLGDYIEAGFPRPYDQFVPLSDYDPISEKAIPDASVDLVCMYIGLHHAPIEKLDAFIASIKRVLRPGGTFILMDHDAYTSELQNLVNVVHSIFNAATGVEPAINNQEIRNFHSLQYWIDLLQSHDLIYYSHDPLIRQGDSTLNSLVRFDKPAVEPKMQLEGEYRRNQMQTYLTAPEWQNVRAAQRYAEFVENEPAYRYPYFSEIAGFWKIYGDSWQAANKHHRFSEIALSEYNLMNLFVGSTMTLEYGVKGVLAAPFALFDKASHTKKRDVDSVGKERIRSLKDYGNYIEHTPFYKYPYFTDIKSYWGAYRKENKTLASGVKGLFSGLGMTLEYSLKGIVAAPMSYLYGSETMKEADTTHLIVHDPENVIEVIDPTIIVLERQTDGDLKHVEIPRYMHFTKTMLKIAKNSCISCMTIAGQDKIQLDVRGLKGVVQSYAGLKKLYEISNPTDFEYTYSALEVDVCQLCESIRALEKENVEVLFIHDY